MQLKQTASYQLSEGRALASLLGLDEGAVSLILPMLWLGKSDLARALYDCVGPDHFALHEAQEFFYHGPWQENETYHCETVLKPEPAIDPTRLLITTDFRTADGAVIVTLKSTLRRLAKEEAAQSLPAPTNKTRVMGPIDFSLPVIDQAMIHDYAVLSGDDNPVHLDISTARMLGLSNTIVHGMMVMGLTQQAFTKPFSGMATDQFPLRFTCRFLLPLLSGQAAGISKKTTDQDGRFSERLTVLSDDGPHAMAHIQYQAV
jgi:acyl dehydratase